ncbi:MAG: aminotransferase class I/II-fold pyridoxal phosphate-dependent enzyme [Flavobacterium sp.]|jgi:aspartate/methionine/tyrosine aminotransferase|uniref:Aminotransferase n=1 Tax=Flavobacterium macrobrachii TaxID=591204 RepID=A0ABS2CWU6_9FLAO|nr:MULTISPECIES: aminotransferase class I/II-fold pyridoxal phosphate-dependent enzyme [Flavobacterium]MBM6499433.1 aminotransferase class I/II-fold pyridoxal phosphate-dependent enzyme [Flavobacterium macrobrachii]MCZ8090004.1 aminotransferase class I/II-fold pyridoxal phosphate-dependent enzyme [Flavobacterium sp.]MCZ8330574.1 aminotransferase class I/II-fold pyridoxal phosphate-dependent enzyme [Flavobacterium sp.]
MIQTANRLNSVQEYYFSRKLKEVRQLISEGKHVINMGIGSPDLSPDKSVIKAIQNAMFDDKAHEYQSYQGLPELRKGFADFYSKHFNVSLDYNLEILPLMGSKEGIMHISLAFLNAGDKVLIPNPGYPTYASVTELVQAKPMYYDLSEENDWQPNFELLEQMDLSNVKIMWVSYPHMPTGANATLKLFEKLIAFGKKHHILIVNDNPYSFVLNENPLSILQIDGAKDIALELNSLSKTYNMAGWRVGMVLGNPKLIDAILKVKSNMDSGMFYGIQKGAIEALKLNNNWFIHQNEIYTKRRNLIFQLAEKLNCTYSKTAVGMFVWAKLPEGISAEEFIDSILIEKHIFITPGTIFGNNGNGYIRFSLCVSEEKIEEAIKRFPN